jgi:hypothetical protein
MGFINISLVGEITHTVEKECDFGKWVMRKRFVSKELMRAWGGIPKYSFGESSCFSFGLEDSQKLAVWEFFGEVGFASNSMSLSQKSALIVSAERMCPPKRMYDGSKAKTCREMWVSDWAKSKPKTVLIEVEPVVGESLEGLSGLALMARKLRLAMICCLRKKVGLIRL